MSTIRGNIFIVPNRACQLEDWFAQSTRDSFRKSLSNLGLKPEGKLVQVWYTSQDCENWTSHRWPENPEFFGAHGLPERLPESLLEGVKEGDEISLHFGEKTLRLTATQKSYRYARFGTFEETFELVTS
jgi:hypothetical protein